jgi:hypothetical protein
MAAAKLFKAGRGEALPLYSSYRATAGTLSPAAAKIIEHGANLKDILRAAAVEPTFAEWREAVNTASAIAADDTQLTRAQLSPVDTTALPEVDGFDALDLGESYEGINTAAYPLKWGIVKNSRGAIASNASLASRFSTRTPRIGPSGGTWSPKRLRSALLNGRSHTKALPATIQVRWPHLVPIVAPSSLRAILSMSSKITLASYPERHVPVEPMDARARSASHFISSIGSRTAQLCTCRR